MGQTLTQVSKRRLGRGTTEIAGPKGINQRTEEKETLMRLITPAYEKQMKAEVIHY